MSRRFLHIPLGAMFLAVIVAWPSAALAQAPAEFVAAWKSANDQVSDPVSTWKGFLDRHKESDLAPAARVMLAAAMLRKRASSADVLAVLPHERGENPADPPLTLAIKRMAARARMMQIGDKLQAFYKRKVEYPATLDELVAAKLATEADLLDPFGRRFEYQPKARRLAPDVPRQDYVLISGPVRSDQLAAALAAGAEPIRNVILSSVERPRGQAFVKLPRKDGTPGPTQIWNINQSLEGLPGVTLALIQDNFLVLVADGFPKLVVKE